MVAMFHGVDNQRREWLSEHFAVRTGCVRRWMVVLLFFLGSFVLLLGWFFCLGYLVRVARGISRGRQAAPRLGRAVRAAQHHGCAVRGRHYSYPQRLPGGRRKSTWTLHYKLDRYLFYIVFISVRFVIFINPVSFESDIWIWSRILPWNYVSVPTMGLTLKTW